MAAITESKIHMHSFWELFHLKEGNMTVTNEDMSCMLEKNQMLIVPPNTYHSSIYSDDALKKSVFFTFEKVKNTGSEEPLYDKVMSAFAISEFCKFDDCDYIANVLCTVVENNASDIFAKSWRLRANVVELIFSVYDKLKNIPDKQQKNEPVPNSYWVYKYAIDRLLDIYYIDDITLEFLSKKLFTSPQNITRIISNAYGKSFNELKLELKIRNAKKLLRETNLSVAEIGERVGYKTLRGFLSAFMKYQGCTPSEYRKKYPLQ
jgi:AraC-like DNA-binding protein